MDRFLNSLGACPSAADSAFGPTVEVPCRDGFDFTFAFEQYFFAIAPCALVIVTAPPRLYHLSRRQPKIYGNELKYIKLVRTVAPNPHRGTDELAFS